MNTLGFSPSAEQHAKMAMLYDPTSVERFTVQLWEATLAIDPVGCGEGRCARKGRITAVYDAARCSTMPAWMLLTSCGKIW